MLAVTVFFRALPSILAFVLLCTNVAGAAATTGTVAGIIEDLDGHPVAGATVTVASNSSRRTAASDERGAFMIVDLPPATYVATASAEGKETSTLTLVVLPGRTTTLHVRLAQLATITTVRARAATGVHVGGTSDLYTLSQRNAQAPLTATGSGLSQYSAGLAQGAAALAPGVQEDQFANAIVRGGRTNDTLYLYDGVPVAQALLAEPGGNVIGAGLPTTGVGLTDIYLGGFSGPDAALGGVVNEIPATGIFPAAVRVELAGGMPSTSSAEFGSRWATPELHQQYAVDVRSRTQAFSYGNGRTFYPAEAATYGLALADRASWSASATARLSFHSYELGLSALTGSSVSDQYGTPLAGPYEPFTSAVPSRIGGNFNVVRVYWTRRSARSSATVSIYRSEYAARTDAPFFDDLSFPNGIISYVGNQRGTLTGMRYEVDAFPNQRLELRYGGDVHGESFAIHQDVPQLSDGSLDASPFSSTSIAYLSGTWRAGSHLTLSGALRFATDIDSHASAVYENGPNAVRVLYDHVSVAPHGLERALAATPLSTESGSTVEISLEHHARAVTRLTYFNRRERNLIDLLPQSGQLDRPQNIGDLNARGFEFSYARGGLTLAGTYQQTVSSSASQLAINDLNAAAVAAGHLFPIGYVPNASVSATYGIRSGRVTISPSLSWESGYPYGNGRAVWVFDAAGRAVAVPNDNHVNPGYNYYFLRDPSHPYDPTANPYIGSLGTNEGEDPNTLRSPPQLFASIHLEAPIGSRLRAELDVANLFGASAPTQLQGNPYLIGPPGYTGGNPAYASWYGKSTGNGPYTLGNGVPTIDGRRRALPWTYGTGGYVPSSYPQARSLLVSVEWSL